MTGDIALIISIIIYLRKKTKVVYIKSFSFANPTFIYSAMAS